MYTDNKSLESLEILEMRQICTDMAMKRKRTRSVRECFEYFRKGGICTRGETQQRKT